MKKLLLLALPGMILVSSCRKIEIDGNGNGGTTTPPTTESTILSGTIRSDINLKTGKTYTLRGIVYVAEGRS